MNLQNKGKFSSCDLKYKQKTWVIIICLVTFVLYGCREEKNIQDLHTFIAKVEKQEVLPIKP